MVCKGAAASRRTHPPRHPSRSGVIRGALVGSGGLPKEIGVKDPKEVALAYVDLINKGDLDGLLQLMPDDYVFVDVDGKIERGKELMREGWSGYFSEFPDYKIHLSQVVALGDVVVLVGRTTDSQIPREIEAEETVIWTAWIRDGLVKEWRILYADTEKVRRFLSSGHSPSGGGRATVNDREDR